jgi:hypothetical protein
MRRQIESVCLLSHTLVRIEEGLAAAESMYDSVQTE